MNKRGILSSWFRKTRSFHAIGFLLVLLLGQGLYWNWKQDQREDKKRVSELHERVNKGFNDLLELDKKRTELRELYSRNPGLEIQEKIDTTNRQMSVKEDSLQADEKELAKLEHRERRPFSIKSLHHVGDMPPLTIASTAQNDPVFPLFPVAFPPL